MSTSSDSETHDVLPSAETGSFASRLEAWGEEWSQVSIVCGQLCADYREHHKMGQNAKLMKMRPDTESGLKVFGRVNHWIPLLTEASKTNGAGPEKGTTVNPEALLNVATSIYNLGNKASTDKTTLLRLITELHHSNETNKPSQQHDDYLCSAWNWLDKLEGSAHALTQLLHDFRTEYEELMELYMQNQRAMRADKRRPASAGAGTPVSDHSTHTDSCQDASITGEGSGL